MELNDIHALHDCSEVDDLGQLQFNRHGALSRKTKGVFMQESQRNRLFRTNYSKNLYIPRKWSLLHGTRLLFPGICFFFPSLFNLHIIFAVFFLKKKRCSTFIILVYPRMGLSKKPKSKAKLGHFCALSSALSAWRSSRGRHVLEYLGF